MDKFSLVNRQKVSEDLAPHSAREVFVPTRLVLAREARGMSQSALAKATGITQGYISKVENAVKEPSAQFIEAVSDILTYPKSFFFRDLRLHRLPLPFYRRQKTMGIKTIRQIEAQLNLVLENTRQLLEAVELPTTRVPSLDFDPDVESPSEVAKELRIAWNVPRGPLGSATGMLEKLGCLVIPYEFASPKVDGLSIWPDDSIPPVVFVSRTVPGDRQRFSVLHELGHLVLHNTYPERDRDLEQEADGFAAEFLMPADDIKADLRRLDLERLVNLKIKWRVSMGALIMRAKNLKCITVTQSQSLWKKMSRLGYRKIEPIQVDREDESLFSSILRIHLDELGYSESSLSETLAISTQELRRLYLNGKSGLRIV